MNNPLKSLVFMFLAGLAATLPADENADRFAALPKGIPMVNPLLVLSGKSSSSASLKTVEVSGMPFKTAYRAEAYSAGTKDWDMQLNTKSIEPFDEWDRALIKFRARSVSENAMLDVVFEKSSEPWTKFIMTTVNLDKEWKTYYFPVLYRKKWDSTGSYPAGGTHLAFNFGHKAQVFEIAELEFIKYPQQLNISLMPSTTNNYPGRNLDAAWRKAADERIEKYRKADLEIAVVDKKGKAVGDCFVQIEMKRHRFMFGTALSGKFWENEDTPDAKRYKEEFLKLFNAAVVENHLKWPNWENPRGRYAAMKMLEFFEFNNIAARGHCLVWPSWRWLPKSLEKYKNDPSSLRNASIEHVKEEVSECKGRLVHWDVMNEPYANHDLMDLCGKELIKDWFTAARESDSRAKLYVNDYDILSKCSDGDELTAHQKGYFDLLTYMKNTEVPFDGIGFQGHFGGTPTAPEKMLKIFDTFAQFGKEISITEYDNEFLDEKLSADFTRDLITVAFSHPSVNAFLMWGFWDGAHWLGNAPVYDKDWNLKESGKVYSDLVFKKWWTNESAKTDKSGACSARVFMGEYLITVSKDGKSFVERVKIGPGVNKVTLTLR